MNASIRVAVAIALSGSHAGCGFHLFPYENPAISLRPKFANGGWKAAVMARASKEARPKKTDVAIAAAGGSSLPSAVIRQRGRIGRVCTGVALAAAGGLIVVLVLGRTTDLVGQTAYVDTSGGEGTEPTKWRPALPIRGAWREISKYRPSPDEVPLAAADPSSAPAPAAAITAEPSAPLAPTAIATPPVEAAADRSAEPAAGTRVSASEVRGADGRPMDAPSVTDTAIGDKHDHPAPAAKADDPATIIEPPAPVFRELVKKEARDADPTDPPHAASSASTSPDRGEVVILASPAGAAVSAWPEDAGITEHRASASSSTAAPEPIDRPVASAVEAVKPRKVAARSAPEPGVLRASHSPKVASPRHLQRAKAYAAARAAREAIPPPTPDLAARLRSYNWDFRAAP
jgi:hypothetical protein